MNISYTNFLLGVRDFFEVGVEGPFNVRVLEILGNSLENLITEHITFSLKTTLMLCR
jgi:hypothetical protein